MYVTGVIRCVIPDGLLNRLIIDHLVGFLLREKTGNNRDIFLS